MFGHVDYEIKAAPGIGIVSSAVLQSDCLDEIDWEWLGGDDAQVQSNYFGKGITSSYNRGAFHAANNNHDQFHTYSIDWTSEQIVWQIDGVTVRAMTYAEAETGQYPQTPMRIKVGAWSGGDPSNPAGTIQWAGGPTNYAAGPFTMYLKSIAVTDYSTGSQYTYSDRSGTWQSIQSNGGKINDNGSSGSSPTVAVAPTDPTSTSQSTITAPLPFEGTHAETTSSFVTPSIYPWIGSATATLETAISTAITTTISGLPSGWTINSSGKVVPPSAASTVIPSIYLVLVSLLCGLALWY
jgi:beta-glucanase (GH16 family)